MPPYKAALSITLDNLGEAADLHRGLWPSEQPIGNHFTATETVPKILDLLDDCKVKATYFIEGWNFSVYSDTIREVAARGHEVGFHAWQHEVWKSLDAETEVKNLDASVRGVEGVLGHGFRGFRPPGGLVTEQTLSLMKERGFTYLSPAAKRPAVVDGVAMVPFKWEDIDAYFYLPSLAPVRERNGDVSECLDAQVLKRRMCRRVDQVVERGEYASLLFHPFLTNDEERLDVMRDVVEYAKGKRGLWVAKCEDVAGWIHNHVESFGIDPQWDTVEWKKK